MAKKNVVVFVGGEYKPQRLMSGLVGFKAPFPFTVKSRSNMLINLNMTCQSTLVFKGGLVETGSNIIVDVKNDTGADIAFSPGDVIARAYPLFAQDFDIG